jgi:hypothetical protein
MKGINMSEIIGVVLLVSIITSVVISLVLNFIFKSKDKIIKPSVVIDDIVKEYRIKLYIHARGSDKYDRFDYDISDWPAINQDDWDIKSNRPADIIDLMEWYTDSNRVDQYIWNYNNGAEILNKSDISKISWYRINKVDDNE